MLKLIIVYLVLYYISNKCIIIIYSQMYAKIPAKLQKKSNIHKFYEINSIFANTERESFYFTMQKMSAH